MGEQLVVEVSQEPVLESVGDASPWTLVNLTVGDNVGAPGRIRIYGGDLGEHSFTIAYNTGQTGPSNHPGPPPDVLIEVPGKPDVQIFPFQPQTVTATAIYLKTHHGQAVARGTAKFLS